MKSILLPTDFSENSKNAIEYAMRLFENEQCTFYVLHVQKASHYATDDLMAAPANTSIHQTNKFIGLGHSCVNLGIL